MTSYREGGKEGDLRFQEEKFQLELVIGTCSQPRFGYSRQNPTDKLLFKIEATFILMPYLTFGLISGLTVIGLVASLLFTCALGHLLSLRQ